LKSPATELRGNKKILPPARGEISPGQKSGRHRAEEKFKELGEAYEALSDPQKRAAYDQFGHAAFDPRQRQPGRRRRRLP
jgi:curved DNA-binding protein CbpA